MSHNSQYLKGPATRFYKGSQEGDQDPEGICSEDSVLLDILEEFSVQQRIADPLHGHANESKLEF
jgi:hypothetical protein